MERSKARELQYGKVKTYQREARANLLLGLHNTVAHNRSWEPCFLKNHQSHEQDMILPNRSTTDIFDKFYCIHYHPSSSPSTSSDCGVAKAEVHL